MRNEPIIPGTKAPVGPGISEAEVEKALHWLVDNAPKIGKAKQDKVVLEYEIKAVEGELFKESQAKTVDAKWAEVYSDQKWRKAVKEAAKAAGEYEKLLEWRRACELRIETWRTEQATWRANKLWSSKPYEGDDERNYEPSEKELKDKPGYPYNTVRGVPKVRYEKSKEELERERSGGPK